MTSGTCSWPKASTSSGIPIPIHPHQAARKDAPIPVPPDIILWEFGAYAGAKILDAVWDKLKERWPDIKVKITRMKDDD